MNDIVYTSIIGGYDILQGQPVTGDTFLAFIDDQITDVVEPWNLVKNKIVRKTPRLTAKWFKVMSHLALPQCEYSLWVDGCVRLTSAIALRKIAEQYMQNTDLLICPHPQRTCIYEEAWECIHRRLDDRSVIYDQISRYTREGYPSNSGLVKANVIMRRHTPDIVKFNEVWWHEICEGSIRDQISFNYVAWKTGLVFNKFPDKINGIRTFEGGLHQHQLERKKKSGN